MSENCGKARYFETTPDDFKRINGIGPKLENRLFNAGIKYYEQLVAFTPDEIISVLGKLIGISEEKIIKENWIGQARMLAEEKEKPTRSEQPDFLENRLHYASYKLEFLLDDELNIRRTRIDYIQTADQDGWAGWDKERLLAFILRSSGMQILDEGNQSSNPTLGQFESAREDEENNANLPESGSIFIVSDLLPMIEGYNQPFLAVPQDRMISFTVKLNFVLSPKYLNKQFPYIATVGLVKKGDSCQHIVGFDKGVITISESLSLQVTSQAIPTGTYRMFVTVELDPETQKPTGIDNRKEKFKGGILRVY
jgi:hypothetical protein